VPGTGLLPGLRLICHQQSLVWVPLIDRHVTTGQLFHTTMAMADRA
jgi:hypothetical protein